MLTWEGFTAWDLVMPLFLFHGGAAMPFSFEKYRHSPDKSAIYKKITKRFLILFILGIAVQGNLFSYDIKAIRIYTNTLQAIARICYSVDSSFTPFKRKGQIIATSLLLVGYWALLTFLGDFSPEANFAEVVDRSVLGRVRDGCITPKMGCGTFRTITGTWVLTSMVFGVTTMLGVFARADHEVRERTSSKIVDGYS